MPIEIEECKSTASLRRFVQFSFDLYSKAGFWIPTIKKGELRSLLPLSNPAFKNCEARFWIARLNGKPAGRTGAIISQEANKKTGLKMRRLTVQNLLTTWK
jgi:hypothetical protein